MKKATPTTPAPKLVDCPQCSGAGTIEEPAPLPGAVGIRVKSPEVAFMEGTVRTTAEARDGWRKIAEALLAVAFGKEMRGFSEVPPHELLAGIHVDDDEDETVAALRDSLIGRAWRVRGKAGDGTCDYPLCQHRGKPVGPRPALLDIGVEFKPPSGVADAVRNVLSTRRNITMRVCGIGECLAWSQWVKARALAGTIQSR